MKQYLLAVGGTGNKILEGVVWAAAAGVLDPGGELRMLSVDVDASCGNTTRAMQSCAHYEAVRELLDSLPYTHRGFHTPLWLRQWNMDLSRRSQSVRAQTESLRQGRLLARTLFTSAEASLAYSEGFRGHPDLGVLFFSDLVARLEEDAAQGKADELLALLREIGAALEAGEKVKVLLCGSIFGGTGAAGIPVLSRALRERFAARRDLLEMGAVLMLPYYHVPPAETEDGEEITVSSGQFLVKARTALSYYGMEGLIRQGLSDEKGLYDAVFLLGLPETHFVTTGNYSTGSQSQENDAHLLEWLAARCVGRFLATDYREREGANINCYYYQMASTRLNWDSFDTEAAAYRRAYGGLMKTALAWRAELYPELRRRLGKRRRLGGRTPGWYAANFRRLGRKPQEELERMARQAEEVDACLAGFVRWMGEVASNLPPQLRHGRALEQAFRDSRENLRALMEEAARHDLAARLTEQKVRESRVSRTQDEEGDEALRRPLREQEEKLRALTARQEELDKRTGGEFRLQTLEALRTDARRGLERARASAGDLEKALKEMEAAPSGQKDAKALARAREILWKENRRADIYAARIAWLDGGLTPEARESLMALAPAYDPDAGLPLNELFDPAALQGLRELYAGEDAPAARKLKAVEKGFAALVSLPAPDPVTLPRLMACLGSGAGWNKRLSPLALLLAQTMECALQEGKA